jgi:hypothetical protein
VKVVVKKIILSFVFLFVLGARASAYLLSDGGEVLDINALQLYRRDNFSTGFEVSNYLYKEPEMKFTGTKYGLYAEYIVRRFLSGSKNRNIIFGAYQFRFMAGDADYDGRLMDAAKTKYKCCGIKERYFEFRVLKGLVIRSANLEWHPYTGVGTRVFLCDLGSDPQGYDRRSVYIYVPLGVMLKCYCKKGLSFDICGEFDWMGVGLQQSDMRTKTVRNIQSNGYGLRLSGKISKEFKKIVFFVSPFVRYWDIPESDEVKVNDLRIYEPKNCTLESGVQLGVFF